MKLGSSSPYRRFGEERPDPVIPSLSRDLRTDLCMRRFGKLSMTRERTGSIPCRSSIRAYETGDMLGLRISLLALPIARDTRG